MIELKFGMHLDTTYIVNNCKDRFREFWGLRPPEEENNTARERLGAATITPWA